MLVLSPCQSIKNAQTVIKNLSSRLELQSPQALPQLGVLRDYQAHVPSPTLLIVDVFTVLKAL